MKNPNKVFEMFWYKSKTKVFAIYLIFSKQFENRSF